jgi:hypothetical protein
MRISEFDILDVDLGALCGVRFVFLGQINPSTHNSMAGTL